MKVILVLEDEFSLSVLKSALEQEYALVPAQSAEDAASICKFMSPNLLVADASINAPRSNLQTLRRIHEDCPQMPFLITSETAPKQWGDVDFECFAKLGQTAVLQVLLKPLTIGAIRRTVAELIAGREASSGAG